MPTLVVSITLFVLALLIGIEVIGKVPATLHTPLMSCLLYTSDAADD